MTEHTPAAQQIPVLALERVVENHPAFIDPAQNPAAVYLASLGERSQRVQEQALRAVLALAGHPVAPVGFPWWALRYQHVQAIRARLAERYPPATANRTLSALRRVLQESWRLGYMDAETYHRAVDVPNIKGSTLPKGRALSSFEVEHLYRAIDGLDTPRRERDAALLSVLYAGGLRRGEAVALDVGDFEAGEGCIRVRFGKGRKEREVFLENGGRDAVEDWLAVRGPAPGPMFYRIRKGGAVIRERLTDSGVWRILQKWAAAADVRNVAPHDLRRSHATDKIAAGVPLPVVQRDMGHASVTTTARYDRSGREAQKAGAKALRVPYRRRAS